MRLRLGAVTAGAAALALAAGAAATASADEGPVDAGITVQKIDDLPDDFINGVDVSTVLSEEESGVVFRDDDGNPADIFDVLADAGINYVRVRVWNDPYNAEGEGYGAGNVDVDRATEIGERATAAGLRVLVDFHYSDFWADPGKQKAPKAWAGYTVAQTADAVEDFTHDALQQMKDAGVDVGMVQVGNETNNGIAGVTGMANMVQIFSAGSAAVRAVFPHALVAVHFTNPETAGSYAGYAQALDDADVDYDVFASSYYPYWHGTTANLTSVLSDIAQTYGKRVMVAETSWVNTLEDADGTTNSVTSSDDTSKYPVSVQGQATEIRDVMAAVNAVPGGAGLGVFYWEPAWIPVPGDTLEERQALWEQYGSGWATTAAAEYDSGAPTEHAEGSGWDNQALFAADGTPLESLRAFAYARTGAIAPREVTGVESPDVTLTVGDAVTLPDTVTVSYNDATTEQRQVTWEDVLGLITSPGTYTVSGSVDGGLTTTATVTIKAVNYLVDGDFEAGDFSGWSQSGTDPWPDTFWVNEPGANAYGDWAVNVYGEGAFAFTFHQEVTGLEPGDYVFTGVAQGDDLSVELYATTSDDEVSVSTAMTGYLDWKSPQVTVTVPSDGTVTVGVKGSGTAGGWGWLDNFELIKSATGADTSALEELVDQANGLNRSVYSPHSLDVLDAALSRAAIVLAASAPTQQQVADAVEDLEAALVGLEVTGDVPDPTVTNPSLTVVDGDPIALPATVKVTFFDGRFEQQDAAWDDVLGYIDGPGTYTVHGVTSGGLAVTATIVVTARNYVVNGDFETGDLTGWETTATTWPSTFWYSTDTSSVHGTTSVNIYGSDPYDFDLHQAITGVPEGTYVLTAQAMGGSDAGTPLLDMTLSATTGEGTVGVPVTVSGWGNWAAFTTPVTVGADGAVTVSLSGTGGATDWVFLDDFSLVKTPSNVDTSALASLVSDAQALDRAGYTDASLAALDAAIARALVVLSADDPSAAAVDGAVDALRGAIDGLELTPGPAIAAAKGKLHPGDSVLVTLTNMPGSEVEIGVASTYRALVTVPVVNGNASATVTIPTDLEAGTHHLQARDASGAVLAEFAFEVVAAPSDTELSATGFDAAGVGALALALLGAGLALCARPRYAGWLR